MIYTLSSSSNYRISKAAAEKLNVLNQKYFLIFNYGNTTAASVGIVLSEVLGEKN